MTRPDFRWSRMPLWVLALALGLLLCLWLLRRALAPFFLAMVLAYLLEPAVARLTRRMRRGWALTVVFAAAAGAVALAMRLLVPQLIEQGERLVQSLPRWRQALEARWGPWLEQHPAVRDKLIHGMEGLDPVGILKGALGAGADLLAGLLQAMTFLLVPVIVWYLLVEGHGFLAAVEGLVPPRHRERVRAAAADIHRRLGGYIRGQLAVAAAMAVLQGLAFQLAGVPYPWLLGLVAGVSNVVPYSPYFTAMLPGLVLAGLDGAPGSRLLLHALLFTAVQKAEAFYFTPVWVGRASRLHPLEVLLGTLCFGFAFGLLGLIFAVPLMIVVKVLGERLLGDYLAHPWFKGEDPVATDRS
jgi:predicted PurR-regulated permease PerM